MPLQFIYRLLNPSQFSVIKDLFCRVLIATVAKIEVFSINQLSINLVRVREIMCSKVTCKVCKKFTWSGCGEHIDQALAGVPNDQICEGHPGMVSKPGLLAKLFGKRS